MTETDSDRVTSSTSVALYIHGQSLDPAVVTKTLGVQPTEARRAGESRRLSSGSKITQKNGLWVFRIRSENGDIEKMVDELASIFEARSSKITSISGLDAAYVDIFVSYSPGGRLDSQYNIILSNQSINTISRMGTPVQLTCAVTM